MIDQLYLSGVWMEAGTGDFITFAWDDSDDTVLIFDKDEKRLLDTIEESEFESSQFYTVPDEAVEDPAQYLEDFLEGLETGPYETVGFEFAKLNTTIVEDDE